MTGQIEWLVDTDLTIHVGKRWRRATRAAVEALRGPHDECFARLLGCDGEEVVRSSLIWAARGVPVRLWTVGPWQTAIYTVAATEYAAVLREVEAKLTEIDALAAAGLRDGVTRLDPLALREALRAG